MKAKINRLEDLKQNILKQYLHDPASVIDMCHEVEALATELSDDYSFAFAESYLGIAYYYLNRIDEMLVLYETAIPLFHSNGFSYLEVKAYNILGITFSARQDLISAMDYFISAFEIAKKNEFYEQCASVTNNMAMLFSKIKDFRSAIEYMRQSVEYSDMVSDTGRSESKQLHLLNLCLNLVEQKRYQEAKTEFDKVTEIAPVSTENLKIYSFYLYIRIRISKAFGLEEDYNACLPKLVEAMCKQESIVDQLSLYKDTCEFLLKDRQLNYLELLMTNIEEKATFIDLSKQMSDLCSLKINYLKIIGADKETLNKAYEEYFTYSNKYHIENRKTLAKAANMSLSLDSLKKEQQQLDEQKKMLVHRSEYDALTKLPNRVKLKNSLDFKAKEAEKVRKHLGVILIDVDCFKQYNDTFGHPKGDRVLRSIGGVLRSHTTDDVEFFRYGGDEFIGITFGLSDSEIENLLSEVDKDIFNLGIKGVCPARSENISITSGYINVIPEDGFNINTFINDADKDLYEKKSDWKLSSLNPEKR